MRTFLSLVLVLWSVGAGAVLRAAPPDAGQITAITGLPGAWNAGRDVYKVTAPRNDLPVAIDGWQMPPFMGLTSWAAFTAGKEAEAMVMGDLVLFEDEVNPVMRALLDAGVCETVRTI